GQAEALVPSVVEDLEELASLVRIHVELQEEDARQLRLADFHRDSSSTTRRRYTPYELLFMASASFVSWPRSMNHLRKATSSGAQTLSPGRCRSISMNFEASINASLRP